MPEIRSTSVMIEKLSGMLGTEDLSQNEERFVQDLVNIRDSGNVTKLTDKQVEWLTRLHGRHFA